MLGHHLPLYHHIVYVDLNILAQLWFKHFGHHPLIGRTRILQTKRHYLVVVISYRGDKSCLFLIIQSQRYLVVSLKNV